MREAYCNVSNDGYLTKLDIRGYSNHTSAKSGVGIGLSDITTAHYRVCGFFMRAAHQINGGLAVESKDSPGCVVTGKTNSVSSPPQIGLKGGDNSIYRKSQR